MIIEELQNQINDLDDLIRAIENARDELADALYQRLIDKNKKFAIGNYVQLQDIIEEEITALLNPDNYRCIDFNGTDEIIYNKQEEDNE